MDHSEALATNASDRYLLGQLSAAEADAFEEHYFDCATCADDVRLGMRFLDGGRRLVRETGDTAAVPAPVVPITSRSRWNRWVPAAAAAIVAVAINVGLLLRMQSAVPRLGVVGAQAYFHGEARTESGPVSTLKLPEGMTVELAVDVLPERSYPRYEARVLRGERILATYRLAPAILEDTVKIPLPDPGPGTYAVAIVGLEPAGETEIVRHRFNLTR